MKIENLLILGVGAFALMSLMRGKQTAAIEGSPVIRAATPQTEEIYRILPIAPIAPAPRIAQIVDVGTVPIMSEANISVSCIFDKCEVLDNSNIVATLIKGETWKKCYFENAAYGFANCCVEGSVMSEDGSRFIGCKNGRMYTSTGVQNISHLFQVREVL